MRPALSCRKILLVSTFALLALALGATPAQAIEIAPPEPHSPNAEGIRSTYWVTIVVVLALIVIVNAALIAAVVRFRDRRGREPRRFAAGRGALRPVIGGLSLLALAVFVYGVIQTVDVREVEPSGPSGLGGSQTAQVGVKGVPPEGLEGVGTTGDAQPTADQATDSPLEIAAIAQQWLWRFEYPGGRPGERTFSYGELVVPVDTAVVLNVTSTDVLHSWWVPALGGQVQAAPGTISQTWFKADEVGRYEGRSTVFSGSAYPAMRHFVRVVSVPEYQDYIEQLDAELDAAQQAVSAVQDEGAAEQPAAGADSQEAAP